eukprot:scaffold98767_cov63-Phaeocystis_antarctica.AAC.2
MRGDHFARRATRRGKHRWRSRQASHARAGSGCSRLRAGQPAAAARGVGRAPQVGAQPVRRP